MIRPAFLIAKSVLIEAIRRREIYALVFVSCLLIAAVWTIDFFGIEGLSKFYRDVSLKIMSVATALATIVLAARQLPREFETRTIYPLLAKPIGRTTFLAGKLLGVLASAFFCFALFMVIYLAGSFWLGATLHLPIFLQFIYLQMLAILILASLSFWLSLSLNLDAAITIGAILYGFSTIITSALSFLYDYVDPLQQRVLFVLNYAVPHLTLFDLSEKAVHAEAWGPVPAWVILSLTAYALAWSGVFLGLTYWSFRRRPL